MNTIPARNLRVLLAGFLVLVLLAVGLYATSRPHQIAPDAGLPTTAAAVELGILDQQVVDEVRAGGSDAFVSLNVEPLIAEAYRRFPDSAHRPDLVAELDRLIAALKDRLAESPAGAQVLDRLDGLSSIRVRFTTEAEVLQVLRLPFVSAVRANSLLSSTLKESTVLVHQPQVKAEGYDGNGTYVAVLDTFVRDTEFPDFFPDGSVALHYAAKGTDGTSGQHSIHGTHVASTVLGMAPATKILAIDVFKWFPEYDGVRTPHEATTDGVQYVLALKKAWIENHTQCCNVVAMNLSIGQPGEFDTVACTDDYSFDVAYAYGIIPVVSAGNDAHPADRDPLAPLDKYDYGVSSPACGVHALSVGSSTDGTFPRDDECDSSTGADDVSYWSQTATILGMLAPGQCITAAGGEMQGTSMAAPHVSGGVAVLASAKRDATAAEIWSALVSSGPTISDGRFDPPVVKHRLDLEAAVATLLGTGIGSGSTPAPVPEIPAPAVGTTDGLELGQTSLDLEDPIAGGERGSLGEIRLRNTGITTATYRFSIESADADPILGAPPQWFEFSPDTITLAPGEAGTVDASVVVPLGADAGTYTALVLPVNTDPAHDTPVTGLRTTFTVQGGDTLRGVVALGTRAAASMTFWAGVVIAVLLVLALRSRRRA